MVKDVVLKGWVEKVLRLIMGGLVEYELVRMQPIMTEEKQIGVRVEVRTEGPNLLRDSRVHILAFSNEGRLMYYSVIELGKLLDEEMMKEREEWEKEAWKKRMFDMLEEDMLSWRE